MNARALLLSAYDAKSHRTWRQRLTQMFPTICWQQLTLAPRNFNWRIRGNSLLWALSHQEELNGEYDFLLATSMVDLSSLRGLVPTICEIPTIVYFHENQFAYPANLQRADNIEPKLVPVYSALCADKIVFNSHYNRSSFLEGAKRLFNQLPDKLPESALAKLEDSCVIPVPVDIPDSRNSRPLTTELLHVAWNHRWEYDKGPELLLAITRKIVEQMLPIQLHILGESFRNIPAEFAEIEQLLNSHAESLNSDKSYIGYIENEEEYYDFLASCDVVLATARHDFQGLAIQEACLAGCTPLVPNKLVYPEYLPQNFLYRDSEEIHLGAEEVVSRLACWLKLKNSGSNLPKAEISQYNSENLINDYRRLFEFPAQIQKQ